MVTSRIVNRRTEIAEGAVISDFEAADLVGRLRTLTDNYQSHVVEHGATREAIDLGDMMANAAARVSKEWPRIKKLLARRAGMSGP